MTKRTNKWANRMALLKLALVMLVGTGAGAAMFFATLRSQPNSATDASGGLLAGLSGLTTEHAQPFAANTLQGRYALVYFGFTFCPDACPTALYTLTLALAQLDPDTKRIQPVFVSIDPRRDTPVQLNEYLSHFSERIIGLTGSTQAMQTVEQDFGVIAVEHRDANLPGGYTMDHSNEFLLFSPTGKLLVRLPADLSVDEFLAQLRGLTQAEAI